ncbi:aldehyde dehydrogenase family 3 member F1-like isoform X1 [Tasmannia lanceolata]|uniref:aldehyde dehydrogenase family 3 member F1-like isoform X1 n=1 Tax=Tasmannia lanceolata TaxID=3420 RepID=UPI0040631238
MELLDIDQSMEELRESFKSRKTRSIAWRRSQLKGLQGLLEEKEGDIFRALQEDLGKPCAESYRDEVGTVKKSLNLSLACLEEWTSSKKVRLPMVLFPTSGELVAEPLGVVLIITSWNFPLGLALEPLIGAIAAGNAAVVKPSELSPACSSFLATNIPIYLDNKAIKVIQGGVSVSEQLLDKKWDKIFFTGSARVGRIVMSAASKHLTPVILELGGKCPAIYDTLSSYRDTKIAIRRITLGKWGLCSGQACIGIDYLLVEERNASALVNMLKDRIQRNYGNDPRESNSMSRIVNKHHFQRLRNILKDPKVAASIVHGGSMDEDTLFIEPTILMNPPLDSEIMTEEIFGPILPIITLKKIEDSIEFISSRPQPLAIYAFTKNETLKKRIVSETSSGSITFNDCIIQFVVDALPFGGVGQSGFGKYHGKFSFDAFSHEKAVLRRSFITEFSSGSPPWNDFKLGFLRAAYNFDYIALFLMLLGLKRS